MTHCAEESLSWQRAATELQQAQEVQQSHCRPSWAAQQSHSLYSRATAYPESTAEPHKI